MKIKLPDTYFSVTGNFKGTNGRSIRQRIRNAGGLTHESLSVKTQVLVCGEGYVPRRDAAIERGIPVIGWKELEELFEGKTINIDMPGDVVPERSLEETLGAAREALSKDDPAQAWEALVSLIDACADDQVESLVDYIDGHINNWPEEAQLACQAPIPWLTKMSQEQDSPAYRLLRSLVFDDIHFNGTQMTKCLKRPWLENVSYLNLAVAKKLSATAFKTLVNAPGLQSVTHLGLGFFDEKMLAALAASENSLQHITTLSIYPHDYWQIPEELYTTLGALEIMKGVQTIIVRCRNSLSSGCVEPLQNLRAQLPQLSCIELERFHQERIDEYIHDTSLHTLCTINGEPL